MKWYKTDFFRYTHLVVDSPNKEDYHMHMHNGYEFLYFYRGDAEYIIEGATYKLHKRDLIFIKPSAYHVLDLKSNEPYERISIHFSADVIPSSLLPAVKNFEDVFSIEKNSPIDSIFKFLIDAEYEKKCSYTDMLNLINTGIGFILTQLKYIQKKEIPALTNTSETIKNVLNYIHSHLFENITAISLSTQFFVSPSWIHHTFSKQIRTTLKHYIDCKRMLYAQNLLNQGIPPCESIRNLQLRKLFHFLSNIYAMHETQSSG